MLSACLLSAALVVTGAAGLAEPLIRAVDGQVTIHADKMPLSQILDRLAASSGMKITYEGARPSMPVSMTVDGITETEAILRLMEGQGVSYVLATDPTGERVDTLIISGVGAGRPVAPSSQSAASSSSEPAYEEPVADYGHVPLDPAVIEAAGGPQKPDLNSPYLGLPPQHFPPGIPPPSDPTGAAAGTGSRGGYPNVPTGTSGPVTAPSFPTGASFPTR